MRIQLQRPTAGSVAFLAELTHINVLLPVTAQHLYDLAALWVFQNDFSTDVAPQAAEARRLELIN